MSVLLRMMRRIRTCSKLPAAKKHAQNYLSKLPSFACKSKQSLHAG